jgi:2-polyprenyl-3-methyl-5-hydroxy-6-metoxy-1,4-benzoquinol methylase
VKELILEKLRPVHITDIGCGGGDLALKMVKLGRRLKWAVKVTGVDANPHVIAYARAHCKHEPAIDFRQLDIFSTAFSSMSTDIITATLFLHHFTDQQLVDLFSVMKKRARVGIVINDIHRHPVAYHSIRILTKLFSRSPMVKNDAPVSVSRAFKRSELEKILKDSGIVNYSLKWKWAFRWQLVIMV